jgi:peroxiredoxin Q/BCP
VVVGVSFDTVSENRRFAQKHGFPYLLLSDPDRRIGLAYHAASDPDQAHADRITYVIGPDGLITHVFAKVKADTHPAEVLAALS